MKKKDKITADMVIGRLTKTQIRNLKTLASYLAKLPEDYRHFAMRTFYKDGAKSNSYDLFKAAPHCDTVACALGHGPAAGVLPKNVIIEDLFDTRWNFAFAQSVAWQEYCYKYFIPFKFGDDDGTLESNMWSWCFSSAWDEYDDTPLGAAKRIMYMLSKGIPRSFDDVRVFFIEDKHVVKYQNVVVD